MPMRKICKNISGLKIHQAGIKCQVEKNQTQRAGVSPGETQEVYGQEAHHSAQSLQAEETETRTAFRKIKWPTAANKKTWHDFDTSIGEIVNISAKGSVENRLLTMSKIIISYAKAQYGYMEIKERSSGKENWRETKIKQLRAELKSLRKQYKKAKPDEQVPLREVRDIIRAKLRSVRRTEWHRRGRKERAKKWIAFSTNPYAFTKKILGEKRSCYLESIPAEIDSFRHNNLKDPNRDRDLRENTLSIRLEAPTREFDLKEPMWDEIKAVIKTRSASASGLNGVPYNVYKQCPQLLHFLGKLIKIISRRVEIGEYRKYSEGIWIPKRKERGKSNNSDTFLY